MQTDPYEGGKQAVAEAWRNLTAVGAEPIAITDNLNFGNPERPEIMGQIVRAIEGMAEACRALDFPVVSGNVSLYNETNGAAIPPTPTVGAVGLIDRLRPAAPDFSRHEGRRHPGADRRDPGRAGLQLDLSARDPRPRGRRPAAGRPGPGAQDRRLRARA